MKALIAWLDRLATVTPEDGLVQHLFRVVVPGLEPLDVANWLLSIDPQGPLPSDLRASTPESASAIRLLDLPGRENSLPERHRLGADLACLITLALDRRAVIPNDVAINIPQLGTVVFQPVAQIIDRGVLGPLPSPPKSRLEAYLSAIAGLGEDDQATIGAAASMYHGAVALIDHDARAAYTLLVSGLEVLSRQYGSPPEDWTDWEESAAWDAFAAAQLLTPDQAAALRSHLMDSKQLRLKATFRSYAASRLTEAFWAKPWEEWIYGVRANDGQWLPATPLTARTMADILPGDRNGLRRALGLSYDLRSAVVHRADWVELISLALQPDLPLNLSRPLPFAVLRTILAELIWLEVSARSSPRPLPDFQLLRSVPEGGTV
jgi:hypothetical protein